MSTRTGVYSAIWRWHFYAGLLTLPILVLLAVTGGLYLFKDEITNVVYARLVEVEPGPAAPLPASRIVAAATAAVGGRATAYLPPVASGRSARVYVESGSGAARDVFVDPNSGVVLGDLSRGDYGNLPLMHFVRYLHSLELVGWPGNRLIEIVAGWTLILVVTGVYLWWPRGQSGGVLRVRRAAGPRAFWRDLHAVTGIIAGSVVFFLALTGMPWSGFWGEHFKDAVNAGGLGYPDGYWFPVAESSVPLSDIVTPAPWALTNAPVPESMPPAGADTQAIGVDRAVATLTALGMSPGYTLAFPTGPAGVYSASVVPDRIAGARVIHLDQYSGAALFDARYADLGAVARLVELGTSLHTGQQLGRANQFVMLAACLAILVMCVAAASMWWKRRPQGSLGAPPLPENWRTPRTILLIAIGFGVLLPLVGLSLLVALVVDVTVMRRLAARPT
jgi:uncharacterized iron-regulated membrane protein